MGCYRGVLRPDDVEEKIHAVTKSHIQEIAGECRKRARIGIAVVGRVKGAERIAGWL